MKKLFTSLIAVILISYIASAQLSGPLSGILEGDSTYSVIGNISVEEGDSLIIEAGATLIFSGNIQFNIYGYLHAAGTETDSVKFISNLWLPWKGIDFETSSHDSSRLEYCYLTGSSSNGIYCDESSPVITNCTISGNTGSWGGGIYCYYSSPVITNCTISGNTATSSGGGIYCSHYSFPTIANCTISGNSASYDGGGIDCGNYSSPTIDSCTINGNTTSSCGGGINCDYYSSPTISNCTISGNSADWEGGGIFCGYESSPVITNCTISGNTADWEGGGIFCGYESSPTIDKCTINGNTASYGGGLYIENSIPGIANCTFSGNSASSGNAVFIDIIYSFTFATILNTIFEGHGGVAIGGFDCSAAITYCDFYNNQGNFSPGFGSPYLGQIVSTNLNGDSCDCYMNIFMDPLFVDTLNGNYNLQSGSPCINAGDPNNPPDPDGTISDMGAYYFDQSVWVGNEQSPYQPQGFIFHAPYPNPFNPNTILTFELPKSSDVSLVIYNIKGREVARLVDGWYPEGIYECDFDGSELSSGVYFACLNVGNLNQTRKLLLLK